MNPRTPDTWECRYVARELPERFLHPAISSVLRTDYELLASELCETDDYLLARTAELNIKIRHRSNSLKLKSLRAIAPDRLECWRTDFDQKLPAPSRMWRETLRLLECDSEPMDWLHVRCAEGIVKSLRRYLPDRRIVRVDKLRALYGEAGVRIEVAQFAVGGQHFGTLCVESEDPARVREVLARLATVELGRPCNYIEVLHESTRY